MSAIRGLAEVAAGIDEEADFVVVGSGAAGAVAAWKLTADGHDVCLIEEGPAVDVGDFRGEMFPSMARLYRDGGMEAAVGRSVVSVLQGRVLGGTTVVNGAIAWRLPEDAYDRWAAEPAFRAAFPLADLHRHWDTLDALMSVRPTPLDVAGRNNTLPARGAERLGWSGKVINRYETGCRGSGRCLQGCPNRAKASTARTLIPAAVARGMRVVTSCLVEKVVLDGRRATGVTGRMRDAVTGRRGPRVRLHARKGVVLAPGCVQVPGLLEASGFRHPHLGRHFRAHPGSGIVAKFPDEVRFWAGATQGWECEEFRSEGMKFETVGMPHEVMAGRLPGVGRDLARRVREIDRVASWGVQVRAEAEGRVRSAPGRPARVSYTPTRGDVALVRAGIHRLARLAVSAGATAVMPGIWGLAPVLAPHEIDRIKGAATDPRRYTMIANHLFGTARASRDEAGGVVDCELRPWGTERLWVVDSSVFPTNLGVNPQHTIMAVAMHAAERLSAGV